MANLLWVLVAILLIAWILGLGGVLKIAFGIAWLLLIAAILIAVLAFIAGGAR